MAASELSIEQIHKFLLEKGGIVANREVVRHFKRYLTDPLTQDDARAKFKKFVNILATTKSEGNEKFLILRQKYTVPIEDSVQNDARTGFTQSAPNLSSSSSVSSTDFYPNASPTHRQPPPYRPPPPVTSPSPSFDNISLASTMSIQDQSTPQAPPRRKSGERSNSSLIKETPDKKFEEENVNEDEPSEGDDKLSISVKERTQKFNRMASVDDVLNSKQHKKKLPDKGVDEDDGASVILSDTDTKKFVEWYVTAAKGEYQNLAKLASNEPRFVKLKDPYTAYTVLHWGAKHGNPEIIKLFAGTYKCDVNAKTNGGYTPLHLAARFGHENVYRLLVDVYHANENIRDFSGRTPSQYKSSQIQPTRMDAHKKGRKKLAEKDLGFLRIGSLNVRVKKTTEAFSNFLGVGTTVNPVDGRNVHKGWGSADNVTQEYMLKDYKKKSKRPLENVGTNSTPGTPNYYPRAIPQRANFVQDSDSDTAAGFDSNWQN